MPTAVNPQTGELLVLGADGQWAPPTMATNPQTGEKIYLDGQDWKPVPFPSSISDAQDRAAYNNQNTFDKMDRALTSGATMGFSDEAAAAKSALVDAVATAGKALLHGQIPSFSDISNAASTRYDQRLSEERGAEKQFSQDHPVLDTVARLAGAVGGIKGADTPLASTLVAPTTAQTAVQAAKTGGTIGAITGFGSGEGGTANRLENAAKTGTLSAILGAATPYAVQGAVHGKEVLANLLGSGGEEKAQRLILRAMERDGLSLNDAVDKYNAGQLTGIKPEAMIDLGGENVRGLMRGAAAIPGPAKQMTVDFVAGRQAEQPTRIAGDIETAISPNTNYQQTFDDLLAAGKTNAAPLYEKAFQGGSIAPLESQLRDAVQAATAQKGQIARQIAQIERDSPGALASRGAAGAQIRARYMDLHNQLAQAENDRVAALNVFQKAQSDAALNAPGAIYNPRIQQFLNDPILQSGLGKGMQIQRLEALAEGRPFNPTEYAITGTDEAGKPIVSNVPNMRTLDAAKKGLDAIVADEKNPITGKLSEYGRAVDMVRRSFLKELDALNPDYAAARAAFAGPARSREALDLGRGLLNEDSEVAAKELANLAPGDKQFVRAGLAKALRDRMAATQDGADIVKRIFGNPAVRERISAVFDTPEQFQAFANQLGREKAMFANGQQISPRANSRTAVLSEEIGDVRQHPVVQIGTDVAAYGPKGAIARGLGRLYDRGRGINPNTSRSLAEMLLATAPNDVRAALATLAERKAADTELAGRLARYLKNAALLEARTTGALTK